jgi:hypothetical protein
MSILESRNRDRTVYQKYTKAGGIQKKRPVAKRKFFKKINLNFIKE